MVGTSRSRIKGAIDPPPARLKSATRRRPWDSAPAMTASFTPFRYCVERTSPVLGTPAGSRDLLKRGIVGVHARSCSSSMN